LHVHAQQRGCIVASVLRRNEEGVGQRMVDEDERPAWVRFREGVRERLPDGVRNGAEDRGAGRESQQVAAVETLRHPGVRRTSQSASMMSTTANPTKSPASTSWSVQKRP